VAAQSSASDLEEADGVAVDGATIIIVTGKGARKPAVTRAFF
jgi:hypothetical protein